MDLQKREHRDGDAPCAEALALEEMTSLQDGLRCLSDGFWVNPPKMSLEWLLGPLEAKHLHSGRFPILPICDEIHHVIYMDGIWLTCKCAILIACTNNYAIGRHLAKSENFKDRGCLMQRIASPDVLVCDRAGGIGKAMRILWPNTKMQRCIFHAFCQIKRCATARPKTQAGVDLYAIAKDLMHIKTNTEAAIWMARFQQWCADCGEFLKERSENDCRKFKHEKPRKARRALTELCNSGTLFIYLDEDLVVKGPVPSTSNKIENLNERIRRMLSAHRGINIDHRIKAVFWFCYMESEEPISFTEMLKEFPADKNIARWRYQAAKQLGNNSGAPARWGEGLVWSEFHNSTPYPFAMD